MTSDEIYTQFDDGLLTPAETRAHLIEAGEDTAEFDQYVIDNGYED